MMALWQLMLLGTWCTVTHAGTNEPKGGHIVFIITYIYYPHLTSVSFEHSIVFQAKDIWESDPSIFSHILIQVFLQQPYNFRVVKREMTRTDQNRPGTNQNSSGIFQKPTRNQLKPARNSLWIDHNQSIIADFWWVPGVFGLIPGRLLVGSWKIN